MTRHEHREDDSTTVRKTTYGSGPSSGDDQLGDSGQESNISNAIKRGYLVVHLSVPPSTNSEWPMPQF